MILNKIFRHFQLKFKDRTSAAIALSDKLKGIIKEEDRKDSLVLAIPRAGTLTANIVSKKLSISNFDMIIPAKLTDPDNKEQAIGAVMDDGSTFILHDLVKDFQISDDYLEREITSQIQKINQRTRKYFHNLQRSILKEKIEEHKIILLIDDGIATGATMMVSTKWISQFNKKLGIDQKRIIIATPIAPKNITEQIRKEWAVEVETVFHPSQGSFYSVEQYHQNFEQVTDEKVIEIIEERMADRKNWI